MKIRVPGSALLIDQLKQLGAAPIAMSLGEVLPAFQNGTIDGVYAATTIFAALKYYDISKNMTLLPDTFILVLGIINRDFLTTVGPLAPVVLEAAHQADLKAAPWGEADVVNAAKVWAEHGGQSYSLSPADAKQYIDTVVPVALKSLTPAARTDYAALKPRRTRSTRRARMIDVEPGVLQDLVDANHILFHQGVVDSFGHVSVRHPARPERFLLARNMAPGSVTADDIIEFDLDGTAVGDDRRVYLERFIHGEILRARPDVMAVVHSHSPSVVPFSIVPSVRFRPVCHMCGFMGAGANRFEIRDTSGAPRIC